MTPSKVKERKVEIEITYVEIVDGNELTSGFGSKRMEQIEELLGKRIYNLSYRIIKTNDTPTKTK